MLSWSLCNWIFIDGGIDLCGQLTEAADKLSHPLWAYLVRVEALKMLIFWHGSSCSILFELSHGSPGFCWTFEQSNNRFAVPYSMRGLMVCKLHKFSASALGILLSPLYHDEIRHFRHFRRCLRSMRICRRGRPHGDKSKGTLSALFKNDFLLIKRIEEHRCRRGVCLHSRFLHLGQVKGCLGRGDDLMRIEGRSSSMIQKSHGDWYKTAYK